MAVTTQPVKPSTIEPADASVQLEPAEVKLSLSPRGVVRMTLADRVCYRRVTVRRVRPLSEPDRYVALWADNDTEIGIIADVGDLDADSGAIVRQELARRYRTPTIRRILRVRERFGVQRWFVDSSHGPLDFYVKGLHQNIALSPPHRLMITDVCGNRYDIPDVTALDARSYAQIQRHL